MCHFIMTLLTIYVLYLPEYKMGICSVFTCVKDGNFFLIPHLRSGGHLAVAHKVKYILYGHCLNI